MASALRLRRRRGFGDAVDLPEFGGVRIRRSTKPEGIGYGDGIFEPVGGIE